MKSPAIAGFFMPSISRLNIVCRISYALLNAIYSNFSILAITMTNDFSLDAPAEKMKRSVKIRIKVYLSCVLRLR